MAGTAIRVSDFPSNYSPEKYGFLNFAPSDPLSTKGLNYSSGAPWFNTLGELSYLLIAKTNGTNGGYSIALDLNTPEIQAYPS